MKDPLQDNILKSWELIKIYELAADKRNAIVDGPFGTQMKVHEFTDAGIPVIEMQNIKGDSFINEFRRYITEDKFEDIQRSEVESGDLIISKTGSLGYVAVVPEGIERAIITSRLAKMSIKWNYYNRNLFKYFMIYLRESRYWEEIAKGTTMKILNIKHFQERTIPLPPINEQSRIANKIDELFSEIDKGVESLTTVREQLKVYRQALLKHAFEGKLTAQWRKDHPDVEPASKLLKRIIIERREKWEEAELDSMRAKGKEPKDDKWKMDYREPLYPNYESLPPLPADWAWCHTDQLFSFVTSGSRGWAQYYSDEGAFFLRIGNLDHDSIYLDLSDIQRVSPPKGAEGTRTRVRPNDILISITADVGMIAVIPENIDEAYINQHISLVRPIEITPSKYIAWFLASRKGQKQFQELQRGATKVGLGLDDIRAINIPLPPLAEQMEIIFQIEQGLSVIDEMEKVIDSNLKLAVNLRQSILKKAFSGQLVPQDPSDEPASLLLERIRAEREAAQEKLKKVTRKKEKRTKEVITMADLMEVLKIKNDWISAQEAFRRCGIADGSGTDDIERIYVELRDHVKTKRVEVKRRGNEDWLRVAQGV